MITAAAAVGGLAPDIDMAHSKAGRPLRKALRTVLIISAAFIGVMQFIPDTTGDGSGRSIPLILGIFCALILVIIEKSKHRGFTHTCACLLIVAAPLIYMIHSQPIFIGADIAVSAQIGFVLGWFSHMVIDTFNPLGTPWLWPLAKKHFSIMRINTGTMGERVFCIASVLLFAGCYSVIIAWG